MQKKVVLVAFNGESMCFVHVLLNAIDMNGRGYDVKIVVEGSATKLIKELNDASQPFSKLYVEVREKGLIDCVCRACSAKMGSMDSVTEQNLPFGDDMSGHPSISGYLEQGYEVITF